MYHRMLWRECGVCGVSCGGYLERLAAGGWLAGGWGLAAGGWRLAGGWLAVPTVLERLAVPTLWRGIVFGGVGLAIGGFWKVFSYPPYKRDFPKPPLCPFPIQQTNLDISSGYIPVHVTVKKLAQL